MTDTKFEILHTIYKECNAYAREQAKRRDSIITIYLAIYAAYIGYFSASSELSLFLILGLFFFIFILGVLCSIIILDFRTWTIQYVSCARALGALLVNGISSKTMKSLKKQLKKGITKSNTGTKSFFKRGQNILTIAFNIITATPIFVTLNEIKKLSSCSKAIIAILYVLLYTVVFYFYAKKRICEADRGGFISQTNKRHMTWIIDFDLDTKEK